MKAFAVYTLPLFRRVCVEFICEYALPLKRTIREYVLPSTFLFHAIKHKPGLYS